MLMNLCSYVFIAWHPGFQVFSFLFVCLGSRFFHLSALKVFRARGVKRIPAQISLAGFSFFVIRQAGLPALSLRLLWLRRVLRPSQVC